MKKIFKVLTFVLAMTIAIGILSFRPLKANAASGIDDFVTRCYSLAFGRTPDADGFNAWKNTLVNRERTGSTVVYQFIFSDEYKKLNKSDAEFVNDLYTMFLGRPADQAGYDSWCGLIQQGWSREDVFAGFANSLEFNTLCSGYGISAGFYTNKYPLDQVNNVNLFVERLYQTCLGRLGDIDGQKMWVEGMLNGTYTGIGCAENFIKSSEYVNLGLSDEQYVENLYVGFMGRSYDEAGKASWMQLLNEGKKTRDQVFEGFANSVEFNSICAGYGIECGEYKATDIASNGSQKSNSQKRILDDGYWAVDEYDADGKVVKSTLYNPDGSISYWNAYGYDSFGRMTKQTRYNSDGSIEFWMVSQYDSNGNMINYTAYYPDGRIWYVNECDANGNTNKWIIYNYNADGSLSYISECDANMVEMRETVFDENGNISGRYMFEYYSNGNRKKVTGYYADGCIAEIYEFDTNGAQTKYTAFNHDGSVLQEINY